MNNKEKWLKTKTNMKRKHNTIKKMNHDLRLISRVPFHSFQNFLNQNICFIESHNIGIYNGGLVLKIRRSVPGIDQTRIGSNRIFASTGTAFTKAATNSESLVGPSFVGPDPSRSAFMFQYHHHHHRRRRRRRRCRIKFLVS